MARQVIGYPTQLWGLEFNGAERGQRHLNIQCDDF